MPYVNRCSHNAYRKDVCVKCYGPLATARGIFRRAQNRARAGNLPITITLKDVCRLLISTGGFCPVLGIPLIVESRKAVDGSPSLDRHVPQKGYTLKNCSVISSLANRIKNSGTPEQIQKVANYAKKYK